MEIYSPYAESINSRIEFREDRIGVITSYDTDASELIEAMLKGLTLYEFTNFFSTYTRKPKTWEKIGLSKSPTITMNLKERGYSLRITKEQSDSVIFNIGSFFQNTFYAESPYDGRDLPFGDKVVIKIECEFERDAWQTAARKDEKHAIGMLHQIIQASSTFLELLKSQEE
jgi:hypothetical protein